MNRVNLFMGRLGWVVFYLDQIGLGNGPQVLGNGPHLLSNGLHVLGKLNLLLVLRRSELCRSS